LGIFLDDVLISAPIVGPEFARTGITGGTAVITGNFTVETATDLAVKLRAGALPVPIQVIENRTVGATLGEVSVRRSLYAGIGGLVLVFLFMVAYYRLPGLIADIALLIYALCTFALFQLLGVTMTLPGIAGFILSIGMAVDANVLIFERIKEELRAGKSIYKSISEGFNRAFSSILDSNVTTLLVCGVLFWLGMGLVKGFAVTLGIGILVSFFTAITCTRSLLLAAMGIPSLRKPEFYGVRWRQLNHDGSRAIPRRSRLSVARLSLRHCWTEQAVVQLVLGGVAGGAGQHGLFPGFSGNSPAAGVGFFRRHLAGSEL
jgi:preprotein translocase subunit SecD